MILAQRCGERIGPQRGLVFTDFGAGPLEAPGEHRKILGDHAELIGTRLVSLLCQCRAVVFCDRLLDTPQMK